LARECAPHTSVAEPVVNGRHCGHNHRVDAPQLTGLNWYWIGIAATVPGLLGLIVAYPFWRRSDAIFGNIVATAIIFSFAFGMIWREHVELDRLVKACLDLGTVCWPSPAAFTRFAIYAFIGLIEVFIVFSLSLRVEERVRRRDYAPEWR
jgi:predicted secreted protein